MLYVENTMTACTKPEFISDQLWRRCLPALRRPEVMRYGSLDGKWDPALPLLSEHNVLAFQALTADYSRVCLKMNEALGEDDAIRLQLGIHIDNGEVTFALPQVLRSKPLSYLREAAGLINRRYQPRSGCPWGPTSVDNVLRRSGLMPGTAEILGSLRMAPAAPVEPVGQVSRTQEAVREARPCCEGEAVHTHLTAEHSAARLSPPIPFPPTPANSSLVRDDDGDSSYFDMSDSPLGRLHLRSNCAALPPLPSNSHENDTNASSTETPIARRQVERSLRMSQTPLPRQLSPRIAREPGFQTNIDDEPFEMPLQPELDTDALDTSQESGERSMTPEPISAAPAVAVSLSNVSSSPVVVKIKPCSRCSTRDLLCNAPPASNNARTKRPACIHCAKSHKTCDMRIVDEALEQEYSSVLAMLEEVEGAYQHDMPSDISPWIWMLEATAKRLQEVPWR